MRPHLRLLRSPFSKCRFPQMHCSTAPAGPPALRGPGLQGVHRTSIAIARPPCAPRFPPRAVATTRAPWPTSTMPIDGMREIPVGTRLQCARTIFAGDRRGGNLQDGDLRRARILLDPLAHLVTGYVRQASHRESSDQAATRPSAAPRATGDFTSFVSAPGAERGQAHSDSLPGHRRPECGRSRSDILFRNCGPWC